MRKNTWAIVGEDNIVSNVISWDGQSEFNPGKKNQLVDVSSAKLSRVSPGWSYADGSFIEPEPEEKELTPGEQQAAAESQRQALMAEASSVFSNWQTKLLLNRATDGEKASLNNWVDYYDALKAVDVSTAPDVSWPEKPSLPDA